MSTADIIHTSGQSFKVRHQGGFHDDDGARGVREGDENEAPGGLRGEGKAACVGFFGSWFGAFPDAHVDVHRVHITDDVAVEEGTFTGTHDGVLHGPMGDVPPTGRAVKIGYIQVLRFRDGKHVSFNLMFDRLSMLEQLGLIPGSAPTG
jgi:predicted ester cyclase